MRPFTQSLLRSTLCINVPLFLRLLFASNLNYGGPLLTHHLFSFVWYAGACSGQSPFWRSVRNLYSESSLIKFKQQRVRGDYETIRNGKITLIFGSATDLAVDEEEDHSSFGFISQRFGVNLQRPKRRMVLFYYVLKA